MLARHEKKGVGGSRGNRAYPLSYALRSMRAYPFRALSLAFTLSLGVSLIGSVFVWADTGVQVSVDGYFDETAFQMLVQNPPGGTDQVNLAQNYLSASPLTESVHRVYSTVGLVFGTRLPDSTQYGLNEPIYTDGMKDCEVILVDNSLLQLMSRDFRVEGQFELQHGEVLVSSQFVNYVHEVFDQTLTINSTIDVELLTARPSGIIGPIGDLGRMSLTYLKVVGIYDVEGYGSLIERGFPSRMRSNYDFVNLDTPVLGIRDSVMILSSSVDVGSISEVGFFGARSFVRSSSTALSAAGADKIAENLLTLKARVDEQFDVTCDGLGEIAYLQGLVDTYMASMPLTLLNLPVFILALFLSVFAADAFMAARGAEVSALRSKGANSAQVYGIFITESVIMSTLSLIMGITLSILLAALIPATKAFLVFDWNLYGFYLANTVLRPEAVAYSTLICIVPPLLLILNSARKAALSEIGSTMMETSEPLNLYGEAYGFTLGSSVVLLAMVVAAAIFLPADPTMLMLELGFGTASWFFMAYNGSRMFRVGFARLSARLSFLLGEKNLIAAGNLRMRKGRTIPLMVVLALTLSSTVAFTVQAQSFYTDLNREIDYAIGADLRVACTAQPFSFNGTLDDFPGVNRVMPVMRTWGRLGSESISIVALDAIDYSLMGHFDETSFGGEQPSAILSRLSRTNDGIIISRYHADRWNKTIGDTLTLQIGGRLTPVLTNLTIVGFVYSMPGFGYAAESYIPGSRLGAGFGFQVGLSGIGITNLLFTSSVTDITTAELFLGDLVCVTDQGFLLRAIQDIPGVSATTPQEFELKQYSFGTALFLSVVEGLFSIGFVMSLLLSIFALTLFLGSLVRERRRDYAILRAVGGSKKQVVNTVFSEFTGIVLACVALSVVLGSVFGYVMSILVYSASPFARILPAVITFPISFLTTVLLIEILAMTVGSYWPAREAAKTDPAIVLRNL